MEKNYGGLPGPDEIFNHHQHWSSSDHEFLNSHRILDVKEMDRKNRRTVGRTVEETREAERASQFSPRVDVRKIQYRSPKGSGVGEMLSQMPATQEGRGQLAVVQQILQDMGYYTGTVDAIYGPLTQKAITLFQQTRGLPVTGTLDPQTYQAIAMRSPITSPAATTVATGRNPYYSPTNNGAAAEAQRQAAASAAAKAQGEILGLPWWVWAIGVGGLAVWYFWPSGRRTAND